MSDGLPHAFVVRRHAGPIAELEPWVAQLRTGAATVRYVRGDRMRTKEDTFAQLSVALQFPLWCGTSWDGLYDVLVTEAAAPVSNGLELVILHAQQLLADEPPKQRDTFRAVFADLARVWADASDGAARLQGPARIRVHLIDTGADLAESAARLS